MSDARESCAFTDPTTRPTRPATVAQLREVSQPPAVRGRRNAEHWTASLYLRHLSPYLTMQLLRSRRMTPNAVTAVMILTGWCIAASLLIPGPAGAVLAVVFSQLQMLIDCCDGEVARWRHRFSPSGVFLDKVGHYTTEAAIPLALGIRAAGYPFDTAQDYWWTTLATLLALAIVLNKALNDMVHAARASAGLPKLLDTQAESQPQRSGLARMRGLARYLPFHRLYHSVEMSLLALAASVVGLWVGQVEATRWLVVILLPLSVLAVVGHFVAIMASSRVRA